MENTYQVTSAQPIPIAPAGLWPMVSVVNVGANQVFLSGIANSIQGFPLDAGNAVPWEAGHPLYAYVVAGSPSAILITDGALAAQTANVTAAITGPIVAKGAYDFLAFLAPPLGVTLVKSVEGYNSLTIVTQHTHTGMAIAKYVLAWYDGPSGTVLTAVDEFFVREGVYSPRSTSTFRVKGTHFTLTLDTWAGAFWSALCYGVSQVQPETYITSVGDASRVAGTPNGSHGTWAQAIPSIASGSAHSSYPPSQAGRARLHVSLSGATNSGTGLEVQIYDQGTGGIIANDISFSALAYPVENLDLLLPRGPIKLVLNNQTAIAHAGSWALTTEGVS